FERGVALLHSFEYEVADAQFEEVAKKDPRCAMAYWGQAMTFYHELWNRPTKADLAQGAELLAKARSLKPPTARERDYIQALSAARKYASIAPSSPHAVHMPSHIFARLGLWQDDINSNLAAIQVADSMAEHHHVMHHKVHSMDFLEYAYMQVGDDASAKATIKQIAAIRPEQMDHEFENYLLVRQAEGPAKYALERRQWKEALALQPIPG